MTIYPSTRLPVLLAGFTLLACASRATPAQPPPAPADTAQDLPVVGFGTLRQEDVALKLATESVQLRVLPLDEQVTRLLAPDSYESLRRLVASRAAEIDSVAGRTGLRPRVFLVTFFGVGPRASFSPDEVTITSQNRFFRPVAILPLSPVWSELRLNQRETASAIYLFEEGITLNQPLTLSYGGISSDQWGNVLRTLERERARVYGRRKTPP